MHICYITSEYPIKDFPHGGIGTFTRSLGYQFVEKGIKVSVIRVSDVDEEETIIDNGITVYIIPKTKYKFLQFIWNSIVLNKSIAKIHSKHPISIVESPELGLAFMNKIKGIKYIIRMHGGHHFFAKAENRPTEWKKVWQEKRSFKNADAILAVSEYVAETTKKLIDVKNKKVTVIYNPIDTTRFYQSDSSKIEKHTLLFVGTIIEKKGIRQLVQALEYLVDYYPDIQLKIAGRNGNIPGTRTPYFPILEKEITEKIKTHITFVGSIPNFEIPSLIEKAQICCYPSHMEAMPLAWLEVLAMGKVFLGSTTGPGPEAVQDGVTGFLVNPHDPKAIANKIKYIFENYDQAIKMGIEARKRVINEFDVTVLSKKNIEFYSSISEK